MAKRKFKLPGVDDLNKDQDRVLRLPEDGQFLIVGGPGTGKSVVALLRALKYHQNNNYVFLVYNHVLHSSTNQLIDIRLKSFTIKSWFYKLQYNLNKELMPELQSHKPNYDEVIRKFNNLKIKENPLHIIIDEGQDMPVKFYESLISCGYENFFIVADQNQQITDDHSSRQELTNILGLEVDEVIELNENYRNSNTIAQVAESFFTDPSSPKPKLPNRHGDIPILFEYNRYERCIEHILREYDRDDRNLIGVVVANDISRDTYAKALQKIDIELDNPKPIISTYSSKNKEQVNIDFSNSGIVVLNDKSIKGLEFDIVFIIVDGFNIHNNDIDSMKKRFYVMSSRAIKKLVFFKSREYKSGVEEILPTDENILKRERLSND